MSPVEELRELARTEAVGVDHLAALAAGEPCLRQMRFDDRRSTIDLARTSGALSAWLTGAMYSRPRVAPALIRVSVLVVPCFEEPVEIPGVRALFVQAVRPGPRVFGEDDWVRAASAWVMAHRQFMLPVQIDAVIAANSADALKAQEDAEVVKQALAKTIVASAASSAHHFATARIEHFVPRL